MGKIILITGGARSGKSAFAEEYVANLGGALCYVATAEAMDDEMQARIAQHQARRGPEWSLVEAPVRLAEAVGQAEGPCLVDCLTLWLSNLMMAGLDAEIEAQNLIQIAKSRGAATVFVTNEVGMGIVPENALARAYRDAAGRLNQTIAAAADEVFFVVAGQPMKVK